MLSSTGWPTAQIVTLVATSSVIAAFLTQGVVWLREGLDETKRAKFAALYIAIALESYARECAKMIGESDTYESSREAAGVPHGNFPELPEYPEVDWKALGIKHAERAMTFRVDIDNERASIRAMWEFGDEDEMVPFAREKSGHYGLAALAIAEALRAQHGLSPLNDFGEYSTTSYLKRTHEEHAQKRARWEEKQRESAEEFWASVSEVDSQADS